MFLALENRYPNATLNTATYYLWLPIFHRCTHGCNLGSLWLPWCLCWYVQHFKHQNDSQSHLTKVQLINSLLWQTWNFEIVPISMNIIFSKFWRLPLMPFFQSWLYFSMQWCQEANKNEIISSLDSFDIHKYQTEILTQCHAHMNFFLELIVRLAVMV